MPVQLLRSSGLSSEFPEDVDCAFLELLAKVRLTLWGLVSWQVILRCLSWSSQLMLKQRLFCCGWLASNGASFTATQSSRLCCSSSILTCRRVYILLWKNHNSCFKKNVHKTMFSITVEKEVYHKNNSRFLIALYQSPKGISQHFKHNYLWSLGIKSFLKPSQLPWECTVGYRF